MNHRAANGSRRTSLKDSGTTAAANDKIGFEPARLLPPKEYSAHIEPRESAKWERSLSTAVKHKAPMNPGGYRGLLTEVVRPSPRNKKNQTPYLTTRQPRTLCQI